jgi:hypothetical protein
MSAPPTTIEQRARDSSRGLLINTDASRCSFQENVAPGSHGTHLGRLESMDLTEGDTLLGA